MFCTNCGSKMADNLKFCTVCGAPLESDEAKSQAKSQASPVQQPQQPKPQPQKQQPQQPMGMPQGPNGPQGMPQGAMQPQPNGKKMPKNKPAGQKQGGSNIVQFIALGLAAVALIAAIAAFVVPKGDSGATADGQTWKYTKLSDSFSIPAGESVDLPAGYPTANSDFAMITGYGYDGMRFTYVVPGINVNLMVPDSESTINKLIINTKDGKISNPTSQSISITGIYKIAGA